MLVQMLDGRCQVDVGWVGMLPDVEQHAKRFSSGIQQIFQVFCLTWMQGVWCAFGHLSFHLTEHLFHFKLQLLEASELPFFH